MAIAQEMTIKNLPSVNTKRETEFLNKLFRENQMVESFKLLRDPFHQYGYE